MDKVALVAALCRQSSDELGRFQARARDAAEGATHEENRAEGDKDMRSTEASYVARGHAQRVADLEASLIKLRAMNVRAFRADEPIALSALVDLEHDGKRARYFLVPAGGGMRARLDDDEVHALASTSPLGAALLGLREGDEAEVTTPQGVRTYVVVCVE